MRWVRPGRLHLAPHRASSVTLAGAYPFLTPPAQDAGVPIGTDALTGAPFCFDPWHLYTAGVLTNPNVVLAGVIGQGKSALAKSLTSRSIAAGRKVYVAADPKGEWAAVADAVGGTVLHLTPGGRTRLNPLHSPTPTTGDPGPAEHSNRVKVLTTLSEITLRRDLHPVEYSTLDAAVTEAERRGTPTLGAVVDALGDPDTRAAATDRSSAAERIADGRDLVHGLRRLTRGDLAGMFDGPSTVVLNPESPMVVLDLSGLGADDDGLACATTCTTAWLDAALTCAGAGQRWIVYDEAWRLLRSTPLLHRMQSQWNLSRALGIANLLILHRLSDLAAVGDAGSQARALAEGLLADCSTRIMYRQESDQITSTAAMFGLSDTERDVLPMLPRGTGLWKLPTASYLVHHRLHPEEAVVFDTDHAMRINPTNCASNPRVGD
jgi:type IV secretory pathway VirB4 component